LGCRNMLMFTDSIRSGRTWKTNDKNRNANTEVDVSCKLL